jgi:hypothetical protein
MDNTFTPAAGGFSFFFELGLGVERFLRRFFFFRPGLGVDCEAGAFFFFFDPGLGVDCKTVFGAGLGDNGTSKGEREKAGGLTDPYGSALMESARTSIFCFKSSIIF